MFEDNESTVHATEYTTDFHTFGPADLVVGDLCYMLLSILLLRLLFAEFRSLSSRSVVISLYFITSMCPPSFLFPARFVSKFPSSSLLPIGQFLLYATSCVFSVLLQTSRLPTFLLSIYLYAIYCVLNVLFQISRLVQFFNALFRFQS